MPSAEVERLVVALDQPSTEAALRQVERLGGRCRLFKVGLELFTAAGPAVVAALAERGAAVFLDLKLHDIPETVARAVAAAGALPGVEWLTVHAGGGREMLRRAAEAARAASAARGLRLRILGVTVLTSLELADLQEVGVAVESVEELVLRRARLCAAAGLDGVVASPREVRALRAACGPGLLIIAPGVRPEDAAPSDQKRTGSAAQAIRDGADLLVIGRPLRDAADPAAAADALLQEMAAARSVGP